MIVGMIMLPSVRDLLGTVVFAVCFGLGFGAVQPATLTWAVARTPQTRWGQAVGMYYTAFDGGMAIAYSSLGWTIQRTSYRVGFWVTAALLAAGLIFYLVIVAREQPASKGVIKGVRCSRSYQARKSNFAVRLRHCRGLLPACIRRLVAVDSTLTAGLRGFWREAKT